MQACTVLFFFCLIIINAISVSAANTNEEGARGNIFAKALTPETTTTTTTSSSSLPLTTTTTTTTTTTVEEASRGNVFASKKPNTEAVPTNEAAEPNTVDVEAPQQQNQSSSESNSGGRALRGAANNNSNSDEDVQRQKQTKKAPIAGKTIQTKKAPIAGKKLRGAARQ